MNELEIKEIPESEHIVTSLEVTSGVPIPALDYLKIFNADSWEDLTLELVAYWKTQYSRVLRCGAGGDMGRDVITYMHDEPESWENYQCKHYRKGGSKLLLRSAPSANVEVVTAFFLTLRYF